MSLKTILDQLKVSLAGQHGQRLILKWCFSEPSLFLELGMSLVVELAKEAHRSENKAN